MLYDETNPETEECIHLIFPAASCTICNPPKVTHTEPQTGRTITAIYDGQCPECNLPIHADRSVIKQVRGKWLHKRCADQLVINQSDER